jgi:phosphoribosylformylglycinamidine cyclo-ligase
MLRMRHSDAEGQGPTQWEGRRYNPITMPTDLRFPPALGDAPSSYGAAGVDIDAANSAVERMKAHIASTRLPGVLSSAIGSFGGMFSLSGATHGMREPVLVSSIDGVGTKLKLAFATGRHASVAGDLVNHCVNDILVQGARPLFFLDYFAAGKLDPNVAEQVVAGLSASCRQAGCVLIGGETAEMPGMYSAGEYDLAGTIVGIVDKERIVTGEHVAEGDTVVALLSNGLHTNGYSLARHVLMERCQVDLNSFVPSDTVTYEEALLAPHQCYAPAVLPILESAPSLIKGMAHITGGGLLENIPRTLPPGLGVSIDLSAWTPLPIFAAIQHLGKIELREMYRVFNMGIGFVAIASSERSTELIDRLRTGGENAIAIGTIVNGNGVTLV